MLINFENIIQLIIDAFAPALRKPLALALLRAFGYPFVNLHATLHSKHEAYAVDYMNWNSQVCRLEGMLNAKFNGDVTGTYYITIGEGSRIFQPYLHYQADDEPVFFYPPPVYGHLQATYAAGGYDFSVNIPHQLGLSSTDPRIIQLLNRYKLAGKQYQIIIT